jgi:hypothetical protein
MLWWNNLGQLKEKAGVVITARGKVLVIGRPNQSTDLLSVCTDLGKKRHGPVPFPLSLVFLVRPFNRIVPDVSKVVTDNNLFGVDFHMHEPF